MNDSDDEDDNEYGDLPDPEPPVKQSTMDTPVLHRSPQLCKINPCLENQVPCAQLLAETGCLCPGISGANEPPRAPLIKALLPITEGVDRGKVEIQWCAPASVVSGYRVVVEGSREVAQELKDGSRRALVGSVEVGTKVCVEAVNNAGHSEPSEFSCKRYDTPESSDHKMMTGVIGGGIALLLLLTITAVIIWRHKKHVKAKKDSSDGLGNPSYSAGEAL